MAARWSASEEELHRRGLRTLYIKQNRTIGDVGRILGISEQTVYKRMLRLGIKSTPECKHTYLNRKKTVTLPKRSRRLAEFFGIMLGDGHVSHFQTMVTLGTKEEAFASYVSLLMKEMFSTDAKICLLKSGYRIVYIGSVTVTDWLYKEGLVSNKVAFQVDVPDWIFKRKEYMRAFLRGFFDTDGSVYKLRFGIQLSFTNRSRPLLISLHKMLSALGYTPSKVGVWRVYLTRIPDVKRFFSEIQPANQKHQRRFEEFIQCVGTQAAKGIGCKPIGY